MHVQDDPGLWQPRTDKWNELGKIMDMDDVAVLPCEVPDNLTDVLPVAQRGTEEWLPLLPQTTTIELPNDSKDCMVDRNWRPAILDAVESLSPALTSDNRAIFDHIVRPSCPPRNFVSQQSDGISDAG